MPAKRTRHTEGPVKGVSSSFEFTDFRHGKSPILLDRLPTKLLLTKSSCLRRNIQACERVGTLFKTKGLFRVSYITCPVSTVTPGHDMTSSSKFHRLDQSSPPAHACRSSNARHSLSGTDLRFSDTGYDTGVCNPRRKSITYPYKKDRTWGLKIRCSFSIVSCALKPC